MPSAISAGYRKGIATIIDANVITLITAFILFVLATAGVKGFAFTLGSARSSPCSPPSSSPRRSSAVFGRARFMRSPRFLGAREQQRALALRLHRRLASTSSRCLGHHPHDRRDRVRDPAAQPGHRLRVRHADQGGARRGGHVEDVRTALTEAGIEGIDDAEIQEVEDDDLGDNVFQIQGKIPADRRRRSSPPWRTQFGPRGRRLHRPRRSGRRSASRSPAARCSRSSSRCS